jgi:hypothetical protein
MSDTGHASGDFPDGPQTLSQAGVVVCCGPNIYSCNNTFVINTNQVSVLTLTDEVFHQGDL